MDASLILYGSRARGEARLRSDVDLILAEDGNSIQPTHNTHGVSVHFYSKGWLEAQARVGNLFAYHVAFEGIALRDDSGFLSRLRALFTKKASYRDDRELAALIMRMLLEKDWGDNLEARRRYFWAIRTILICRSAELGTPQFASSSLEALSGIPNLAHHIDARSDASFDDCVAFGAEVLRATNIEVNRAFHGAVLREHLMAVGGIALDSVRIVEEREAVEVGSLQIYL